MLTRTRCKRLTQKNSTLVIAYFMEPKLTFNSLLQPTSKLETHARKSTLVIFYELCSLGDLASCKEAPDAERYQKI